MSNTKKEATDALLGAIENCALTAQHTKVVEVAETAARAAESLARAYDLIENGSALPAMIGEVQA